jgi:hypothetical protein
MNPILSFILCVLCSSAFSLTIDEVAGPWTVDVEATASLLETQFRQMGAEDKQIAIAMEELKKESINKFFAFTSQTISTYQEQDGAQTQKEDDPVIGLTTDQERLILEIKKGKMALRLRGGRLEVELLAADVPGGTVSFVLKRAAPKP